MLHTKQKIKTAFACSEYPLNEMISSSLKNTDSLDLEYFRTLVELGTSACKTNYGLIIMSPNVSIIDIENIRNNDYASNPIYKKINEPRALRNPSNMSMDQASLIEIILSDKESKNWETPIFLT